MTDLNGYKEITGVKKYLKYKDFTAGQVVLEDAKYVGTEENQFGGLNFLFEKNSETIGIPQCGVLKYNHTQGKMQVGSLFKIIYEGEKTVEKGPMKGKSFHDLKIYTKADPSSVATTELGDNSKDEEKLPF